MRINYHKKFTKDFNKLSALIQDKFKSRLRLFVKDRFHPLLNDHPVDAAYPGWRSINITGDYRAFYEAQSDDLVVFMRIGTHSELYR